MSSGWSSIGARQMANNAIDEPLVDSEKLSGIFSNFYLAVQNRSVMLSGPERSRRTKYGAVALL
jgi:hypothetical protein